MLSSLKVGFNKLILFNTSLAFSYSYVGIEFKKIEYIYQEITTIYPITYSGEIGKDSPTRWIA